MMKVTRAISFSKNLSFISVDLRYGLMAECMSVTGTIDQTTLNIPYATSVETVLLAGSLGFFPRNEASKGSRTYGANILNCRNFINVLNTYRYWAKRDL